MPELFIFDRDDHLLTILSNEVEGACPFWEAPFREELNKGSTFQFSTVGDHEDSQYIIPGNQVAFFDKDGAMRLFLINEPEDSLNDSGTTITAVCQPAVNELNRKAILDIRPYNTTLKVATERVLAGTRWEVGEIAELGINSINHYDTYALPAIQENINTWGGELRDRIEIDGNKITKRIIDIPARRGADTGKRWEDDKDIVALTRTVLFDPVTAIVGRGSSLEVTTEEGEATGGYTRKISFKDVEWKVSKGDPVDKPKGQEWVGDPDALSKYGLLGEDGKRLHLEEIYENSEIEDPAELLRASYEYLQERNKVAANYSMDVFLLEEISGYEHEKARLGDTTFAITHAFAKPIEIEARIIVYEYDVADPENTGTVEMGSFIELHPDLDRFDQIEAELGKTKDKIDEVGKGPVTDDKIENVTPTQPQNILATGSFKNVIVEWDFVGTIAIQHYEVYASQIKGFTPDISNLVYKGKTSIYTHKADSNQQWYFRVRAVNTHGVAGPFSAEASAETARIITDDILFGAINAQLLADLAVEAEKLAHQSVTPQAIAALAVGNAAIQNLAVSNSKIDNLAVGEAQIENLTITNSKIANLAVDDAKIANLSVSKLKAGTIDASKIKIFGGSTTDYTKIDGSFLESRGRFSRTWRGETFIHDVALQFQNGYFAARSLNDDRNLYYSNFGISTFASGDQDESSGTIEFFSYDYHPTRKGITISSVGGVVALRSGLERVIVDAYDHAYIQSDQQQIRIKPRSHVVGNNTFAFHVVDNKDSGEQDGILFFGSENNPKWSSGLRFSKTLNSNTLYITDGDGTRGAGNLEVNDIKVNSRMIGAIEAPTDNAYAHVNNAFKVMNKSGASLRDLEVRDAIMNDVIFGSLRTADTNSNTYIGVGSHELRVTNNQFYNGGNTVYRPIVASAFNIASSRKYKTDIMLYQENAVDIVKSTPVFTYLLKSDIEEGITDNIQIGFTVEDSPTLAKGDTINQYKTLGTAWKALQEVIERLEKLESA